MEVKHHRAIGRMVVVVQASDDDAFRLDNTYTASGPAPCRHASTYLNDP
jgi:hypothetical protein